MSRYTKEQQIELLESEGFNMKPKAWDARTVMGKFEKFTWTISRGRYAGKVKEGFSRWSVYMNEDETITVIMDGVCESGAVSGNWRNKQFEEVFVWAA